MFTERPLFGGAISCEIPTTWRDISDVRQVPDHQEVWQELDGAALVIEVLQRQDVDDSNAASFFFTDLAEANGATQAGDATFHPMPAATAIQIENATPCTGIGYQKIAMGRDRDLAGNRRTDQETLWTTVELMVLRLPRVDTDLLLTLSKPQGDPNDPDTVPIWSDSFQKIASTIKILDWGLFG